MTEAVIAKSPDGRIQVSLLAGEHLRYAVKVDDQEILQPSQLGIRSNNSELGLDVTFGFVDHTSVDEQYAFIGGRSVAINQANLATVSVHSGEEPFFVDIHVANDGVALRVRLNAKERRKVHADRSTWHLPGDLPVWYGTLLPDYEAPQHETTVDKLPREPLGCPLTLLYPGGIYVAITEAAVADYGDLSIELDEDRVLRGKLYADPDGWQTDNAVIQPWRVMIIARDLDELVNTTLVHNLNPPASPELANAAWIVPGRSSWQWLAAAEPVLEEQPQWVVWTAQLGFEYYLIDDGWSAWQDPWQMVKRTAEYAQPQNVKIWIWVHSKEILEEEARREYFQRTVDAGVVGLKIDFPPPSNRTISNWYHEVARDAVEFKLMINFHGSTKPTGIERTWPHVLTREGVRGHEWHITRYDRVLEADHDVILPFTRYVAGAGDYTPTVFTPTELVGNTWTHEIAQAIIFTSPYLCFGGHPASYLDNPSLDVLKAIKPVWDETRILAGSKPGELVAEARRSGNEWMVAIINGAELRSLTVELDFLKEGTWKSTMLRDTNRPDDFDREDGEVDDSSKVILDLKPRGGFVAWIR